MKKIIFLWVFSAFLTFPLDKKADSAILYKEYQIFNIEGAKYLCATHIVQEGDYLYKILRERGTYSKNKLNSLRILNPQLKNINKIEPGQLIYLPIRIAKENEFKDIESGRILVPFITKENIEDLLKEYSGPYEVKPGDTVSKLLSNTLYTKWGTREYTRGVKLFEYINPEIENINLLSKGQNIKLPKSEVVNKEWYPSLFNPEIEKRLSGKKKDKLNITIPSPPKKELSPPKKNILELIANTLNGKLESRGELYLPYKEKIIPLVLSKTPFIKSEIYPHVFFYEKDFLDNNQKEIIKKFYKEAIFFNLNNKVENQDILSKKTLNFNGIEIEIEYKNKITSSKGSSKESEIFYIKNYYKSPFSFLSLLLKENIVLPSQTKIHSNPESIYFKNMDPKTFVKNFFLLLGCKYNEDTQISFPFKGVQIKAYTNIAVNQKDKFLIVDFNEFYGEAINSIKKMKMKIMTINHNESNLDLAIKIAKNFNYPIIKDPVFPQSAGYNEFSPLKVKIPGTLLINHFNAQNRLIFFPRLDSSKFPKPVLYYLDWLGIKTVFI
ncbi:MAG: LysM domain-containing protein [Desulforegulaceae bacterium]|nr:LysM domain-containing protein [Desulforegulaceae bacterium]